MCPLQGIPLISHFATNKMLGRVNTNFGRAPQLKPRNVLRALSLSQLGYGTNKTKPHTHKTEQTKKQLPLLAGTVPDDGSTEVCIVETADQLNMCSTRRHRTTATARATLRFGRHMHRGMGWDSE